MMTPGYGLSRPRREGSRRHRPVQGPHAVPDIRIRISARRIRIRHEPVCPIFLLERQYPPAAAEGFWRVLHPSVHFPQVIQNDIVHLRRTSEEFLEVLVVRAVMTGQVVLLLPRVCVRDVASVVRRHEVQTAICLHCVGIVEDDHTLAHMFAGTLQWCLNRDT